MLFDLSDVAANQSLRIVVRGNDNIPLTRKYFSLMTLSGWGEHCIECGVPFCYKTCSKFEKTFLGWCRRFDGGIVPVVSANGRRGYSVKFRPWGKLEMKFNGRLVSHGCEKMVCLINEVACRVLVRMAFWTAKFFKVKTPLSPFFRVRNYFRNHPIGKVAVPDVWSIECVADCEEELLCSIFDPGCGDVFIRNIKLESGYNVYCLDIPHVREGALFRISSRNGTNGSIVFYDMVVGRRRQNSKLDCKTGPVNVASQSKGDVNKRSEYVKCVAWDLDNTLWDGILLEDGAQGVSLRANVVSIIRELDRRGILNTVCSKNDFDCAWRQLEQFGISQYFVFPAINWNAKSENLLSLSKEINIGIDAFAFIDDSPHERGEVSERLPMVRIFKDTEAGALLDMHCFNPPVSTESANRRISYLAEMARQRDRASYSGLSTDFIKECSIVLKCKRPKDPQIIRRCWELVNRTNQLTLAARRYEESEFSALLSDRSNMSYAISCSDKYGDYGIVGFIAIGIVGRSACVREFVMSCRVAKKYCEQSVLAGIVELLAGRGIREFGAEVVVTGRNAALIEAFDALPFLVEERTLGHKFYKLDESGMAQLGKNIFKNATVIDEES